MHPAPVNMHEGLELPPSFPPRLLHVGAYEAGTGKDYPPHDHSHWELVFYRRGHIRAPVGNTLHLTRPGLLLITPPHTVHAEHAVTAYANFFAAFAAPAHHPWPRELPDDRWGTLAHLFGSLVREWPARDDHAGRLISALVTQLDVLLLRAAKASGARPSPEELLVREVEALWAETYASDWTVSRVARTVGCSPSSLRAAFALARQQSPREALYSIRLRQALARVGEGNDTLETIATECGFASASHLSRRIKAFTGQAAGAWRERRDREILPITPPCATG